MNAHSLRTILSSRNFFSLTILFLFALVAICGFASGRAQSEAKEGREVVYKIPKHLPIKVKVKKPEKLKELENEEWLGEVELEVANTGTKPIYYLEIVLDMPDVFAPNGLNIAYPVEYGRGALISLSEPVRADDVPIQPGGVVVLKVPESDAQGWKHARAKGALTNPKRIEFFFQEINFGDGTGFVGTDGRPLPEPRERGSNAPCAGGDNNVVGAASAAYSPPRYFPDIASLATYLPPPASLVPAFFFGRPASPAPAARQDICCTSPCSRLKDATDQGCPCPGVQRRIVQPASCSSPSTASGTGACSSARAGRGLVDIARRRYLSSPFKIRRRRGRLEGVGRDEKEIGGVAIGRRALHGLRLPADEGDRGPQRRAEEPAGRARRATRLPLRA
jgi:hypothetical protein